MPSGPVSPRTTELLLSILRRSLPYLPTELATEASALLECVGTDTNLARQHSAAIAMARAQYCGTNLEIDAPPAVSASSGGVGINGWVRTAPSTPVALAELAGSTPPCSTPTLFVVTLRVDGLQVEADTEEAAARYALEDARNFATGWSYVVSDASSYPKRDVSPTGSLGDLDFDVELQDSDDGMWSFHAYVDVVVSATDAEAAKEAALELPKSLC